MAGWLSRATEKFRGKKPLPPEPYSVQCDCGAKAVGNRTSSAQKPACPSCSRPVFVLPQNVYPSSAKPRRDDSVKTASDTSTAPAKALKSVAEKTQPQKGKETKPVPKVDGIVDEAPTAILTPFRLVAAAIFVVAGVAGWGLWYRGSIESAKATALSAKKEGLEALAKGDFVVAARELKRARYAVDLLKRTDSDANLIRRACNEAVACNERPTGGFFELLAQIATSDGKSPKIDGRSSSPWLSFDSIVLVPDLVSQPCSLDCPIEIENKSIRIETNSPLIRKAVERTGEVTQGRVIFAAPIQRMFPDPQDPSTIVIRLNDASAFLWSSPETYALQWYRVSSPEAEQLTRELLARQLQQLEEPQ